MARDIERQQGDFFPLLDLPGFPAGKSVRKALILGERPENLAVYLAAFAASLDFRVLVADGANSFDPYLISKFARRENLSPKGLLQKIWVARAFTCHQLATLIRERLAPLVPPGAPSLIVVLGPCTLFFDEDVPGKEAVLLFRKTLAAVQEMSQRGVFFLLSQPSSRLNRQRLFLLRELAGFADAVLKLKSSPDALQVVVDKPPLAFGRPWEVFEEFKRFALSGPLSGTRWRADR